MSDVIRSLAVSNKQIEAFRAAVAKQISIAFERDHVGFETAPAVSGASTKTYRLTCHADSIAVIDARGQEQQVIEVVRGRGWQALVGLTCNFRAVSKARLRFTDCQIITFLRSPAQHDTPPGNAKQVMRLEWEALDQHFNFDGHIAHPHWQLDVANLADVKSTMSFEDEDPVLDRIPEAQVGTDLSWVPKMHLAAAAGWALRDWADERPVPHVSGPQDLDELRRWIVSACRYVRFQLVSALSD